MKLNWLEFLAMNNPVRATIQRHVEARRLLRMGGRVPGNGEVLEIGCGRGVGATLILDLFGATRVDGVDLDPRMVARATRRFSSRAEQARFRVGDVTRLDVREESYDAVFDFGILHHVPDWRQGLREVRRVLRPGGRFYGEEVFAALLDHPVIKMSTDHPSLGSFEPAELYGALAEAGLRLLKSHEWGRHVGWFVADRC